MTDMNRRGCAIIALGLAILIAAIGVWGYGKVTRVRGHLVSLRRHLHTLESVSAGGEGLAGLASADLATLKAEMTGAHADLVGLQAELGPALALTRYLGWVPGVGGDLQAAPHLLALGLRVTGAGELALEAVEPLLAELEAGGGQPATGIGAAAVGIVAQLEPTLAQVSAGLDQAAQARERLVIPRLSPRVARLVERLDRYLPLLRAGVDLARLAPGLMGAEGARAYLILAQNEDELRATGGFISGVGLLRMHQGEILELSFQDSYAVDDLSRPHAAPPAALARSMWAGVWLLRDANWSPDFPTTARVARRIYYQDQGVLVDGVIAVDQHALRLLVDALGPIDTEMFDAPVTGDTVIPLMRRAWASPLGEGQTGDWWRHRKDFMGAIVAGMRRQLEAGFDSTALGQLAYALWQALEGKHILISLADAEAAAILAGRGWDGALRPAAGDYLMAVDTNVGFNKVNPNVETWLDYRVQLDARGRAQATAVIRHQNHSPRDVEHCVQEARYDPTYAEMMNRCYWNYLRVYVPERGRLVEATPHPWPPGSLYFRQAGVGPGTGEPDIGPPEQGKQVFGTFLVVPPGETEETRFTYELPAVAQPVGDEWQYRLLIQKQAGARPMPVAVTVVLPDGASLIAADPSPMTLTGGAVHYALTLDQDWQMRLSYR